MNSNEFTTPEEYANCRLDHFLVTAVEDNYSRTYIQKLVKNNLVTVNGKTVKSSHKLNEGDIITVNIPEPEKIDISPENIPLEIIYQDSSIAIINKQYGVCVHPGAGVFNGTLVNALLYHIKDLSAIGGVERPGIVHRLDKDTSGLIIIAKNDISHRKLNEIFSERKIYKEYAAIVIGAPNPPDGHIETFIERHPVYRQKMTVSTKGKLAITDYKTIKTYLTREGTFSLINIVIHTGRTHQIRVHLSSKGNPVLGDPIYSKMNTKTKISNLMLAAVKLEFNHPETNECMKFEIDYPKHMLEFIQKLEKDIEE